MCVWERERERDRVSLILYVCKTSARPIGKECSVKMCSRQGNKHHELRFHQPPGTAQCLSGPFFGHTCKSELYFTEIFEILILILQKNCHGNAASAFGPCVDKPLKGLLIGDGYSIQGSVSKELNVAP